MDPNLNLNLLRVFHAAAQEESFTRAAQKLHLTQPGISKHVKALEDYFQTQPSIIELGHTESVRERLKQDLVSPFYPRPLLNENCETPRRPGHFCPSSSVAP